MRQFEVGDLVAGKYRLQRPLAKGGMGSVWTALNEQLDVPVAIKFMAVEALGSAELVARFEREAKAAAQMRTPQVVQIFEHGVFQGVPFMAMELLEGEDLSKRLRDRGRLSLAETARIVAEVCKALRRAHELGIVHRDLKPANIFIARSGDEEVIKVLDFGIAKLLGGGASAIEATKTGALIGTPNYMAPEQAHRRNRQVDHRSDLWSLGVIAFRAVTGKLPFAGGDPVDVLMRIITTTAPPASSMAPDLGPEVDRFFARALAPEPEHRFQNARDFAEAMNALAAPAPPPPGQSWSGGAPPPPRAPSPLGQSWSGGGPPPPRPSSPGGAAAVPAAFRRTLPLETPASPAVAGAPIGRSAGTPDSVDGAATIPIQRSPIGQAHLAAATPQPGAAQAGAAPPGLTRQPSSPRGFGPPGVGSQQPSPGASAQPAPATQQGAGEAWKGSAGGGGGRFMATLPLGTPTSDILPPPRAPLGSIPEMTGGTPAVSSATPAAAMSSAGDSAGTITSATGEMPVQSSRRTSYVVWGALLAALLVILVVGSVVVKALTARPEPEPEPIPLPSSGAPTLTGEPPGGRVAPGPTVTPGPTATVAVSAAPTTKPTAGAASAAPTAKASAGAASGGAKPQGAPGPKAPATGTSAILGKPAFSP